MRLGRIAILAGVIALSAGAGWTTALYVIPTRATDIMWNQFRSSGAVHNRLSKPLVRTAKTARVVADNPDTMTRSSIVDLSKGPVLFVAEVPAAAEYWSVSLFAHNTDTYFVANDQRTGPGPYRLLIRRQDQAIPSGVQADEVAVSPSDLSFLIVRATMRDRNDKAGVEALRAVIQRESLTPIG